MTTTIRVGTSAGLAYLVPSSIAGIVVREVEGPDDLHAVELLVGPRSIEVDRYIGAAGALEYAAQLRRELDDALTEAQTVDATLEAFDSDVDIVRSWAGDVTRAIPHPRVELPPRLEATVAELVGWWTYNRGRLDGRLELVPSLAVRVEHVVNAFEVEKDTVRTTIRVDDLDRSRDAIPTIADGLDALGGLLENENVKRLLTRDYLRTLTERHLAAAKASTVARRALFGEEA